MYKAFLNGFLEKNAELKKRAFGQGIGKAIRGVGNWAGKKPATRIALPAAATALGGRELAPFAIDKIRDLIPEEMTSGERMLSGLGGAGIGAGLGAAGGAGAGAIAGAIRHLMRDPYESFGAYDTLGSSLKKDIVSGLALGTGLGGLTGGVLGARKPIGSLLSETDMEDLV